ncbi:YfaP family protein [Tenacibaculum sp. M341]|uniref:YfaP family protein n=1 Tax=Tenacibaculum sp. M341 TaxID=2530339 RepID=UPI00104F9404|nr:hypothetical protein [Tenacibaculum sp. M341]TCI92607.1 hypothetical protein EYW44_06815 [Tenacibaculum sp. M341]
MKKILFTFIFISLISCGDSSDDSTNPIDNDILTSIDINFYTPNSSILSETPQITLRDNTFQVTALGQNSNGLIGNIDKLYISDVDTKTEWIVLLNNNSEPEFMYGINTATNQRLPFLYAVETTGNNTFLMRYYEYDWNNRLGTLLYETKVSNNDIEVIFNNETTSNRVSKNVKTTNRSFPTPIKNFEKYLYKKSLPTTSKVSSSDDLDEFFDLKLDEFIDILKDTKTKLINAPCRVSKILNKSDKNFVCKMSDNLNKITDEKIFGDLDDLSDEEQNNDDDFEGNSSNIDLSFFDDFDLGNITDHINNIRDNIDTLGTSFNDWIDNLNETVIIEDEDLDDLTDSNGVIHIGLSWNTTTDIDLHVTDPFGETIFFDNPTSSSGGYLDRDNTEGFGPENIYWTSNIPSGNYSVDLVYYGPDNGPLTDCTVKIINGLGVSKSFPVTLGYFDKNKVNVTSFRVNANTGDISF